MRPVVVKIADVIFHKTLEMPFIYNDHVVEQVAAAAPNPAFRHTVLPRTSEAGSWVRVGWMPKLFTVSITSSLKFAPQSATVWFV
jgi:hypothetical protein